MCQQKLFLKLSYFQVCFFKEEITEQKQTIQHLSNTVEDREG